MLRLDGAVHLVEFFPSVAGGLQDVFGYGFTEYLLEFGFRGADGLIQEGIDHVTQESRRSGFLRDEFLDEILQGFCRVPLEAFCQVRDVDQQVRLYDHAGERAGNITIIPTLRFPPLEEMDGLPWSEQTV